MSLSKRSVLFILFFLSGFSGLVYQVVWTRMAFAAYGILTPVLSVVISVFMLGLALGSWAGGKWIGWLTARTGWSAASFYGLAELFIGTGAYAVPRLLAAGQRALLATGQSDSLVYLALSAVALGLAILPWCVFMGATIPFMMAFMRERESAARSAESFSWLYLANVLGAMSGTLLSAFVLIELFGFRDTLHLAAAGNFLIGLVGLRLGLGQPATEAVPPASHPRPDATRPAAASPEATSLSTGMIKSVLFTTGAVSMAMEVIWTRAFTPVLKTQVYSFALIVAAYLGATFAGSLLYRRHLARKSAFTVAPLLAVLSAAAFLPILLNSAQVMTRAWGTLNPVPLYVGLLLASISPFCAVLGYLTPSLVDQYSRGAPERAGQAYALNVLGCILGPLLACYVLLPELGERAGLILLALPFVVFYLVASSTLGTARRIGFALPIAALLAGALFLPLTYEDYAFRFGYHAQVRRDYAATVISTGKGRGRALIVNGFGMTRLMPETKFMVHLPLSLHQGPAESALIICFGMGTSYRSALSWGLQTTAVELVPGVRDAFGFYFEDAAQVLKNPRGRIVIDDGRRYLARTPDSYDLIVVDPPPPVETAGSSLLYSKEFYETAKKRLRPGGIMQAWIPENGSLAFAAALRSLCDSFPYVRCFPSYEMGGAHMLASMQPIEVCTPAEWPNRLPPAARQDLSEWCTPEEVARYLTRAFAQSKPGRDLLNPAFQAEITDDSPYNEYFVLRNAGLF
jgi:spermidine synthase